MSSGVTAPPPRRLGALILMLERPPRVLPTAPAAPVRDPFLRGLNARPAFSSHRSKQAPGSLPQAPGDRPPFGYYRFHPGVDRQTLTAALPEGVRARGPPAHCRGDPCSACQYPRLVTHHSRLAPGRRSLVGRRYRLVQIRALGRAAALVQQTIFASFLVSLVPVNAAGPRSSNPRMEGLICVRP